MTDLEVIDLPAILSPKQVDSRPVGPIRITTAHVVLGACKVCLRKASGHHYEVASCNGCKSFFRRVITSNVIYTCLLQDSCYENLVPGGSAPKCKSCRFKKCLKMGMNPLAIQSEICKLKGKNNDGELVVLPKIVTPPKSIDLQISELIEHLVYLDMKTNNFRDCSYNPDVYPSLREAVKEEMSILGIADRMGPMTGWPIVQEKVDELRKTIPVFGARKLPANMKLWMPYEILTLIEMAKTFDFFRKLTERDRYFLFRDTLLMVANLTQSYYSVEKGSDQILNPDGTTPVLKRTEWMPAGIHQRFFVDVGKRAIGGLIRKKITKTEYLLIRAILLCNAAAPEISSEAHKTLFMERKKYTLALLHHTMTNHGSGGPGRFAELLNIIDILERQQKDQRDVYLLINLNRSGNFKIPLYDEVMFSV